MSRVIAQIIGIRVAPTSAATTVSDSTSSLARMNMILHNNPNAKDGELLKTFDFVVANPPFSDKSWCTGLDPLRDPYERFQSFGAPPAKQGDFAYRPHGVLFRGIPAADIEALARYWKVCPSLRQMLFSPCPLREYLSGVLQFNLTLLDFGCLATPILTERVVLFSCQATLRTPYSYGGPHE